MAKGKGDQPKTLEPEERGSVAIDALSSYAAGIIGPDLADTPRGKKILQFFQKGITPAGTSITLDAVAEKLKTLDMSKWGGAGKVIKEFGEDFIEAIAVKASKPITTEEIYSTVQRAAEKRKSWLEASHYDDALAKLPAEDRENLFDWVKDLEERDQDGLKTFRAHQPQLDSVLKLLALVDVAPADRLKYLQNMMSKVVEPVSAKKIAETAWAKVKAGAARIDKAARDLAPETRRLASSWQREIDDRDKRWILNQEPLADLDGIDALANREDIPLATAFNRLYPLTGHSPLPSALETAVTNAGHAIGRGFKWIGRKIVHLFSRDKNVINSHPNGGAP